jgi:hypothetical protein
VHASCIRISTWGSASVCLEHACATCYPRQNSSFRTTSIASVRAFTRGQVAVVFGSDGEPRRGFE